MILYAITAGSSIEEVLDQVRLAFDAGVDLVQIREKTMPARHLCELVARASALPEKRAARLLVNERWDVASACGADGVHLPASAAPGLLPLLLPALRSRGALTGVSCHSAEEVSAAAEAGASFAVFGPVFDTPGKGAALGIEALREACRRGGAGLPVLALGGVTLRSARACLEAGAAGIAAIRLFQPRNQHSALTGSGAAGMARTVAALRELAVR